MTRLLFFVVLAAGLLLGKMAPAQDETQSWYEADAVNEGLGPRPDELNLATPRAAVRAFVELADDGRFGAAAHVLNLKNIEAEDQQGAGPRLAEQLYQVIERRVWIDWSDLPSRPDALVEDGSGNNPQAGQVRRDLGIKLFQLDGRAYEIRIGRFKAANAEQAVWLFTPQTVDDIRPLHDAFGPRAFERLIPSGMKRELGGLRVWEWVALPVMVVLLAGLGVATNAAASRLGRRLPYRFLQVALANAGIPLALFTVALAAQLVLGLAVSFSGPVTSIVQPILIILMTTGVGMAALRVVDAILDRVTLRYIGEIDDTRSMDKRELYTSIYALRRIIVLCMVGFAVIFILTRLNLFESLGLTLLASAGVLTVLLGIAGQAVLGNILASLQIALAKPVRIGDSVLFEGDWAYVESIFYTFMRLRTWDERRIIVPVKHFVSLPFENWSVKDAKIMKTFTLVLDHAADANVLRDRFLELAKAQDGVIEPDKLSCFVTGHGAEGQEITFYAMTPDPSTGWDVEMTLREAIIAFIQENHPEWWPHERFESERTPDGPRAAAAN